MRCWVVELPVNLSKVRSLSVSPCEGLNLAISVTLFQVGKGIFYFLILVGAKGDPFIFTKPYCYL